MHLLSYCIGNCISYTVKKRSAMDAHSRVLKHVAEATALGASVPRAEHYYSYE